MKTKKKLTTSIGHVERRPPSDLFLPTPHVAGTVWHHTTRGGFEGILTSDTVWATDLAHMNDPREIVHGVGVLNEAWQLFAADEKVGPSTRAYVDDLISAEKLRSYFGHLHVFSTTIKEDDLYQWQAYSKADGFSIGIDSQKPLIANLMASQFLRNSTGIGVGWFRVVYKDEQQKLASRLFLQNIVPAVMRASSSGTLLPTDREILRWHVLSFVASLKDSAWAAEREVRNFVVFANARPLYRDNAVGKVPYIRLSGNDDSRPGHHFGKLPIIAVRHGYSATEADIAWARELLDTRGYGSIPLLRSAVPLR